MTNATKNNELNIIESVPSNSIFIYSFLVKLLGVLILHHALELLLIWL